MKGRTLDDQTVRDCGFARRTQAPRAFPHPIPHDLESPWSSWCPIGKLSLAACQVQSDSGRRTDYTPPFPARNRVVNMFRTFENLRHFIERAILNSTRGLTTFSRPSFWIFARSSAFEVHESWGPTWPDRPKSVEKQLGSRCLLWFSMHPGVLGIGLLGPRRTPWG